MSLIAPLLSARKGRVGQVVEESDYSTYRVPCIPAPAGSGRVRRTEIPVVSKGVKAGGSVFDSSVEPRPGRGAGSTGVVLTSDRQLRVVRTTRPRGLRLEGEIDLANVDVVRRVLASAARDGGDIRVDVSKLAFIDVAGLRVFVDQAGALALRDGRMVLVGASRQMVRVLGLCGWDAVPGLTMVERIAPAQRRPRI
nr:STAS domain-containing protein [Streptomyces sp. SID3343]